jgi:hypothetical protein
MKSLLLVVASLVLLHPAFASDEASAPPSLPAPLPNRIVYVAGASQKIKIMPLGDSITSAVPIAATAAIGTCSGRCSQTPATSLPS